MPYRWIGQVEEDVAGHRQLRILRRAEDAEVEGLAWSSRGLGEAEDDAECQGMSYRGIAPLDEENGLYAVEVDVEDDVIGHPLRWLGETEDDVEGQGYYHPRGLTTRRTPRARSTGRRLPEVVVRTVRAASRAKRAAVTPAALSAFDRGRKAWSGNTAGAALAPLFLQPEVGFAAGSDAAGRSRGPRLAHSPFAVVGTWCNGLRPQPRAT